MVGSNETRQALQIAIAPLVLSAPPAAEMTQHDEERPKTDLRRQMYERIARGNALADAEEHARALWTAHG